MSLFKGGNQTFANQSDWGKGGFIVARTTFEVDALDFDSYRLSILVKQGYHVCLNGQRIASYGWWLSSPPTRPCPPSIPSI